MIDGVDDSTHNETNKRVMIDNNNNNTQHDCRQNNNNYTLEQRLFHSLHDNHIHSPTIKEFRECYAFCNASRSFFFHNNKTKRKCNENSKKKHQQSIATTKIIKNGTDESINLNNNSPVIDDDNIIQDDDHDDNEYNDDTIRYVIDVAGGHGALGVMFLIFEPKSIHRVTIIDPAIVNSGKNGIKKAWGRHDDFDYGYYDPNKVTYRHECLRTALSDEMNTILSSDHNVRPNHILVVSCHACQHLSDEILQICIPYQVHIAVLPCCQKDITGIWKTVCTNLNNNKNETNKKNQQEEKQNETFINSVNKNQILINIPKKSQSQQQQSSLEQLSIATCMDLLLTGKVMSWNTGYIDVRMKILNHNITPQNRLILCRSPYKKYQSNNNNSIFDMTKCHNVSTIISSEEVKTTNSMNRNNIMKTLILKDTTTTSIPSSSLTQQKLDYQHRKLQLAYKKAHLVQPPKQQKTFALKETLTSKKTSGNDKVSEEEVVVDLSTTIQYPTIRNSIPKSNQMNSIFEFVQHMFGMNACNKKQECSNNNNVFILLVATFILMMMYMIMNHVPMNFFRDEQQMLSSQLTTIFDGFNKISSDSSHEQQPPYIFMIGLLLGMMAGILIGRNNDPTTTL